MSDNSHIEWTDATWNPVTGCTEVSPGCNHCYAKTFAERWRGVMMSNGKPHPYFQGFDLKLHPDRLSIPFTWGKPRRIFVNSMSDLFHKDVPDEFIALVYKTMHEASLCPHRHTFQVLTKRPERMRRIVPKIYEDLGRQYKSGKAFTDGIWHGVSVESNAYAWRSEMLRQTPARVRFLSIEPMLGPVEGVDLVGIDWVICGGESGAGARPMQLRWVRELRDRCVASGVPFFFKQWGGVQKKRAGRELDGRTWDEFPT